MFKCALDTNYARDLMYMTYTYIYIYIYICVKHTMNEDFTYNLKFNTAPALINSVLEQTS